MLFSSFYRYKITDTDLAHNKRVLNFNNDLLCVNMRYTTQ